MSVVSPHRGLGTDAVETAPLEELLEGAWSRLGQVLEEAADLPFYSERFEKAGVDVGRLKGFDDFSARVPRFRKPDLIDELKRRASFKPPCFPDTDPERSRRGSGRASFIAGIEAVESISGSSVVLTSGTTGFPTFALLGAGEFEHGSPYEVAREFSMDGMRSGMRVMCQYPAWHHLSMLDAKALETIGAECLVPWGTFTPSFAGRALELIGQYGPEYLLTTTTMLHAIVEYAQAGSHDLLGRFEPVRYAMVVGEPVSPVQRELLKAQLGLEDIFERGGSSDGLWGGADCPAHCGHHVWLDHHYLEVVDPRTGVPLAPGERGSVVVTNLTLDRSLYIRFDTEDLGEVLPGTCPCGRTHPRVELYGRLADCVEAGGRLVAPYDVRMHLDEVLELAGVPLVLVRDPENSDVLRVWLDGNARDEGLAEAAAAHLEAKLGLAVEVGWAGPLPKRWKARMAVDRSGS